MLCAVQVLGNLPFNILVAVMYSGIFYGMCGLRRGREHFAKFATIVTLLQIIAAQVQFCY
jgi:ABC-type multidrug transport system permease subunit